MIVLLELTVPFDSSVKSFKSAEDRKTDRYDRLTLDLKAPGYRALNMPLGLGHIKNVKTFKNIKKHI